MSDSSHKPESVLPAGEAPTESLAPRPDLLRFDQPTFIAQRGQPTPGLVTPGVVGQGLASKAALSPSDLGKVLIGERLGHFELDGYVGGGGMGAVFRAKDTQLGRIVALKVLSRDQSNDEETLRRFRNEAQSAARLDHENIARVYFFGEDRGLHFIVFEYIEGINARDLIIRQGPLAWAEALNYTLQVADALAHASGRDVVHRDIKPSNIIITETRRAKLVDMGLARLHQVQAGQEDLTASGVTLGTFDYISPEQARDPRSADVRSDIYSLGCTLYYMLTGQPPFPEGTVLQKLLQHQGDEAPDPRQFNPDVPPELCAIVRRMLAKDPRKRYQTPAALIADLTAVAAQHGVVPADRPLTTMSLPQPAQALTPWERHLPWIVPVSVLIVAALAVEFVPWPGLNTTQAEFAAPPPPPSELSGPLGPAEPIDTGKDSSQRANPLQPSISSQADSPSDAPLPDRSPQPQSTAQPERTEHSEEGELPSSRNPVLDPAGVESELDEPAVDSPGPTIPTRRSTTGGAGSQSESSPPLASEANDKNPSNATSDNDSPNTSNAIEDDPSQDNVRPAIPARPDVLIVSETESGPQVHATLASACAAAPAGAIIELRFDGARSTRPIRLAHGDLTLRAGPGFRPEIVFAPTSADTIRSTAALFALSRGHLRLVNLALTLRATSEAAPLALTLVDVESASAVHLEQCVLTVECAEALAGGFGRLPSMIRVLAPNHNDAQPSNDDLLLPAPAVVELTNCVARGEATLVEAASSQSLQLTWDNGLLTVLGRLLQVSPGSPQPAAGHASLIDVDLQHVTVAARNGLALVETNEVDRTSSIDFRVQDCIVLHDASAALIEQFGEIAIPEQQRRIGWQGRRNFYDADVFWRLRGGSLAASPELMTFDGWKSYWDDTRENKPTEGAIGWRLLPAENVPTHEHEPADYALDATRADNPARGGAGDGSDAGMQIARLPLPPTIIHAPATPSTDGMGMPPLE